MKHIKQIFIVLLCMIIVSGCQTSKQKATNTDNEENVITLAKDTINCKTDGVVIAGTTATITKAGNYTITGTLDNGQVIVDTTDDAKVTLILDNANIHSETSSAIYIKNADTTTITLKENSENHLSDALTYSSLDESGEPDATLFAKDDLVINGTGLLSIQANYKDGIVGKDDVIIEDATIKIQANDDGIQGKDSVGLKNANLAIEAVNDAIKSTNDTDAKKGTIEIHGGSYQLQTSGNDESSHKAIKAYTSLTISEGTFTIDATDDALHAQNVTIDGGQYTIQSGDDGIHADTSLVINQGTIDIQTSYEGIEASDLQIHGGTISIVSSDDGINAAGGSDDSTQSTSQSFPGGPGSDRFSSSTGTLLITGGNILVNAEGDGIDVNGDATITGGEILVYGPTNDGNGALDYDGTFLVNGGSLVAYGSSGMALNISSTSTLPSVMINLDTSIQGGAQVSILDGEGNEIYHGTNAKKANSLIIANTALQLNSTYTLQVDDSTITTFTLTTTVTTIGNSGQMNGGPTDFGRPR